MKQTDLDTVFNAPKSIRRQLLLDVLTSYTPESLKDSVFVAQLEDIGYNKKVLPDSINESLNKIFSERAYDEDYAAPACMPYFRDVYVFRKNNKITGVAKICYGCGFSYFTGTDAVTQNFGRHNELKHLEKIVK